MKQKITLLFIIILSFNVYSQVNKKTPQDTIIQKYLYEGAYRYHYTSQNWEVFINQEIEKIRRLRCYGKVKRFLIGK